jgi:hypothetical protein
MDASRLIGLVSLGPNADLLAALASDPQWNVAEDWGLEDWKTVRAPAGLKFEHRSEGLIQEAVLLVGAEAEEKRRLNRILSKAMVPVRLVVLKQPRRRPHNRLAAYLQFPQVGTDS